MTLSGQVFIQTDSTALKAAWQFINSFVFSSIVSRSTELLLSNHLMHQRRVCKDTSVTPWKHDLVQIYNAFDVVTRHLYKTCYGGISSKVVPKPDVVEREQTLNNNFNPHAIYTLPSYQFKWSGMSHTMNWVN